MHFVVSSDLCQGDGAWSTPGSRATAHKTHSRPPDGVRFETETLQNANHTSGWPTPPDHFEYVISTFTLYSNWSFR